MGQPYVGEIRMFGGNFAPVGWMFCQGQLLPISENETLFQLIGTTYGGDGESTFALPDLQSRIPIHQGTFAGITYQVGEAAGVETVTLTQQQIPVHSHTMLASSDNATSANASGRVLAQTPSYTPYFSGPVDQPLAGNSVGITGGSQPHDNVQPFTCVNFIISLFGIFPSPT